MKNYSAEEMKTIYETRRRRLADFMKQNNVSAAVFEDSEEHRDASVRYFCGHISDGILIIDNDAKSILIPWDINLANENAFADKIIPFTRYERDNVRAIKAALSAFQKKQKLVVEIPPASSYLLFLKIVDALPEWDVRCRENGCHKFTTAMRAIKDE